MTFRKTMAGTVARARKTTTRPSPGPNRAAPPAPAADAARPPGEAARTGTTRVVLADDHPLFRDGLRRLLESEPGFAVVGEAGDGGTAVEMVETLRPDVLLIDLSMPVMTGLDALRALSDRGLTSCRVMLLTAAIDRERILEALQLGARGVVPKESATATLFKAVRAVMKDEYWVGRECVSDVIRYLRESSRTETAGRSRFGLTTRELQVVAAVVEGSTNKDIARLYSLSEDTVKHHLSSIFDKAGVSSRLELALFAINHALVARDAAAS